MTLIDEFSRRCLAIHVARRINALDVIETLADVMLFEGIPAYIRSDNGPEMVAKVLRQWLMGLGTKSLYIEPGSPWENGTSSCGLRPAVLWPDVRTSSSGRRDSAVPLPGTSR